MVPPVVVVTPSTAPAKAKPAVLTITSASFHVGEVGIAYASVSLAASGGVPPFNWSISVGSLPGGLTVASAGTVSGTPTTAGMFSFTVHVSDAASGSAIVNRSIAIARHLTVTGICTTTTPCAVEAGCTICGGFGSQAGGVSPFKYTLVGSIPAGMGLRGFALTGPFPPPIIGIALPPPYRFQVTATDSFGVTSSVTAQFSTFNHISLSSVNFGQQKAGVTLTFSMSYSGGKDPASALLIKDALPAKSTWTIDTVKHVIVVTVPPQSAGPLPTLYAATFQLTDKALCGPSAGQLCSTTGTLTFSV